jgi:alpha-beta hydrolase superfamily lysophospholipase
MIESTATHFTGPIGLRTRGTVLVVPGRGESPSTYQRFGRRLAADSYDVRVITQPVLDGADLTGTLDSLAGQLTDALADIDPDHRTRPVVLVGADTGAAAIAALVSRSASPDAAWWPQGLVLAGLPGYGAQPAGDWDDELDARTSCTVHRGVLSDDPTVARGALSAAVPPGLLDAAYDSAADVPQLLLIGDADPFADRELVARAAKALPTARLAVVRGAHHDVLNDLQHRSVAAEIITFLEALRSEPSLQPIIVADRSAW